MDTALREAEEEIGLTRDDVEILTVIHPTVSRNILIVTPVIGLISSDFIDRSKPNPSEVKLSVGQNLPYSESQVKIRQCRLIKFSASNSRACFQNMNILM